MQLFSLNSKATQTKINIYSVYSFVKKTRVRVKVISTKNRFEHQ